MTVQTRYFVAIVGIAAWMCTLPTQAQQGAADGEWSVYGGDAGSTKYSPLDQINAENVGELQIAWRWKTDNFGPQPLANFQVTPLMVDGVLYFTAGQSRVVIAADAKTGETLWMFRSNEPTRSGPRAGPGRGVAYWTDGDVERIFAITRGYSLLSLDASTGRLDPNFGNNGVLDMKPGVTKNKAYQNRLGSTSPPIVVGDVIVVGAAMPARTATPEGPAPHVHGFDARTGERKWVFHTIPQEGEFGNETWEDDSWKYTGNTGVWTIMSADPELGYVYLPVETPTSDWYGGHRLGDNLFAESLVCLDATTGKRVWHYQIVHHGVFDFDLPAPPILIDINVDGRAIKAVVQITKQNLAFVFDRVTGEPVWPIVERAVPQSTIPGEETSPTQPFPTKPPAYDVNALTHDVLIDLTPELKAEAIKLIENYTWGPLYTPPSLVEEDGNQGTIIMPGSQGGSNWPSGSVDIETGMLFVTSNLAPQIAGLKKPNPARSTLRYRIWDGVPMPAPQGLPLLKPPWSKISAIDLNKGEIVWQIANGEAPDWIQEHEALKGKDIDFSKMGAGGRGGLLVTKTLLFAGEGAGLFNMMREPGGPMFRAIDKMTGAILWEFRLPANQSGVPMTYMLDGKQYIVVAVGGRGYSSELVALKLPGR
jgi:quinoprotein glucose dehydrogenase